MTKRTAPERLDVLRFSRQLLATKDLDPLYVALIDSGLYLDKDKLRRFLLAYWMFYHPGVAALLSEDPFDDPRDFWTAARGGLDGFPRGRERRHFRGRKAFRAVDWLKAQFESAEEAVRGLERETDDFRSWRTRIERWPMFGPWVAFKAADMLEVLGLADVDFAARDALGYKRTRDAAFLAFWDESVRHLLEFPPVPGRSQTEADAVDLVRALKFELSAEFDEPARGHRPIGVQEVETCLCKWASHRRGRYPVGYDIAELREMLAGDTWGETAARLRDGFPPVPAAVAA